MPQCLEPLLPENFSFSVPFSVITNEHSKKRRFSTSSKLKECGKNKKIRGSQGEKLAKCGIETIAVAQKVQQKYRNIGCKANFFLPYLRQAAKIYVATSHSVVRQETIKISEERAAFIWLFAHEVDWCLKDCDEQRWQTTLLMNVWKIFAGHTGDKFDVKTASICTTELWDALKSFILNSLKIKVAPYPIIVSLDTLSLRFKREEIRKWSFNDSGAEQTWTEDHLMKNPQSIHLSYLWVDKCRWKEINRTFFGRNELLYAYKHCSCERSQCMDKEAFVSSFSSISTIFTSHSWNFRWYLLVIWCTLLTDFRYLSMNNR